jgi:hypothetical protein
LTNAEVDSNFTNLNNDKTELGGTYSAGTANGVLFLSASKVLTTGSALTFDGTNFGVGAAGIGGYGKLQVRNGFAYVNEDGSDTYQLYLRSGFGGALPAIQAVGGAGLGFILGSTEGMRLTSTGLGIGTSSPAYKLHVSGESLVTGKSYIGASSVYLDFSSGGLTFATANTVKATLDTSGNLGLGVTPSASNACTNIELPFGATLSARSNTAAPQFAMMSNAVGNWYEATYKINGFATQYAQQGFDGTHKWFTAPSGTAGDAISFTQAMTLDASGNLMLGVTSAVGKLTVNAGDVSGYSRGFDVNFNLGASSFHAVTASSDFNGLLIASNANDATPVNTALPSWGVDIGGRNATSAGADSFSVARLPAGSSTWASFLKVDSSGRFGIGTSSPDAQLVVSGTGAGGWVGGSRNTLHLKNANASGNRSNFIAFGSAATDVNCFITNDISADGTTVNQLNIQAGESGGVFLANGGTSWSSASDERVKDIIEPISDAANKVSTIRAVIGKYKSDVEGTRRSFLIAQDVQAVLPEAVTVGTDEQQTLGLAYTEVIPLLVAAIQELKAEFDAYKASHP